MDGCGGRRAADGAAGGGGPLLDRAFASTDIRVFGQPHIWTLVDDLTPEHPGSVLLVACLALTGVQGTKNLVSEPSEHQSTP